MLEIVINGELKKVEKLSVLEWIKSQESIDADHIVIEYNNSILKKINWDKTILKDGDKLEVVRFVGGG